jgi:hypothetical protein
MFSCPYADRFRFKVSRSHLHQLVQVKYRERCLSVSVCIGSLDAWTLTWSLQYLIFVGLDFVMVQGLQYGEMTGAVEEKSLHHYLTEVGWVSIVRHTKRPTSACRGFYWPESLIIMPLLQTLLAVGE